MGGAAHQAIWPPARRPSFRGSADLGGGGRPASRPMKTVQGRRAAGGTVRIAPLRRGICSIEDRQRHTVVSFAPVNEENPTWSPSATPACTFCTADLGARVERPRPAVLSDRAPVARQLAGRSRLPTLLRRHRGPYREVAARSGDAAPTPRGRNRRRRDRSQAGGWTAEAALQRGVPGRPSHAADRTRDGGLPRMRTHGSGESRHGGGSLGDDRRVAPPGSSCQRPKGQPPTTGNRHASTEDAAIGRDHNSKTRAHHDSGPHDP
jgi:hypothetical protein